MSRLRLFIWTDFCPDYSGGLAIALAKDETDARKLVKKAYGCDPYEWGKLEIRRADWRVARCVRGGS